MIGSSNDETNFQHKSLLTDTKVSKIYKAFANGLSANIKFSKTQLSKMMQWGLFALYAVTRPAIKGLKSMPECIDNKLKNVLKNEDKIFDTVKTVDNFIKGIKSIKNSFGGGITLTDNEIKDIIKVIKSLENRGILLKRTTGKITGQEGGFSNFLRPLMTTCSALIKSVLTPLAKSVWLQLGLSARMSAADEAMKKKIYGSGSTTLIISNEEMEDVMKIVKFLEESGLLIKGIDETITKETKNQEEDFF